MSAQDYLDRIEAALADAHEDGDHENEPDANCVSCVNEQRGSLNREGDPAFNGAFDRW